MKKFLSLPVLIAAGVLLLPRLASAHILPGTSHGFQNGLVHPLTGWDHLLAMLAVGLWAAQHRGRARWMIPLTFVSVMALGGILGMSGAHLPGVELGIALSVLVLGGLIATAKSFQPTWSMLIVGLFAVFHGFAHGAEMPASAAGLSFSSGFLLSTLALHGLGLVIGLTFQQKPQAIRFAGATIALCSVCFL